jgi:hypothetical protein
MSGFDLGGAVNSAADWACSAPVVRSVVSNPVLTALLITALAAIVVAALYHHQVRRGGVKRGARALFYVFFAVTAVTFVHHYATMRLAREVSQQKGVRDVFSGIQQSRNIGAPDAVPVYPMGYEGRGAAVPVYPMGYEGHGAAAPVYPTGYEGRRAAAVGGADCGCGDGGGRPDNVADAGPLVIEDVVIPAAAPFGSNK